ncbi:MAG: phosphodiester glycosidase family protein [Clostridia bacterium]
MHRSTPQRPPRGAAPRRHGKRRKRIRFCPTRLFYLGLVLIALCCLVRGADPSRVGATVTAYLPAPTPQATVLPSSSPPPLLAPYPVAGETQAAVQETIAPTPTPDPYPQYQDGELHYETDRITVDITQRMQEGMVYFACDIQLSEPAQFSYAFSGEEWRAAREALSDIAARHHPVLAINGDFYSFHNNGIIIRGGKLYRKQNSTRHLLIVDQNGDLSVLTDRREKQGVVADKLVAQGVLHTFEFGPELVRGGQAVELPKNFSLISTGEHYEPRTAIGQLGPLHYLVLVVDGRREGYSKGATLTQLQNLFVQYGAQTAFNLDGGGSTTLYFDGRVVNLPSAGDERSVSDIVMFMP